MSGRALKEVRRGDSAPVKSGYGPKFVKDGADENYQGMYTKAANEARSRGGKGIPGDSGSEILDYQEPIEQTKNKRSRG